VAWFVEVDGIVVDARMLPRSCKSKPVGVG
jgi:hypothetical protein